MHVYIYTYKRLMWERFLGTDIHSLGILSCSSITISYTVSCSATLSSTTTEPQSGTINMLLKTHLHTSTVSIGESESKPSTTPTSNVILSSTVTKLITKTMGELA